jgi:hypothetical protein
VLLTILYLLLIHCRKAFEQKEEGFFFFYCLDIQQLMDLSARVQHRRPDSHNGIYPISFLWRLRSPE